MRTRRTGSRPRPRTPRFPTALAVVAAMAASGLVLTACESEGPDLGATMDDLIDDPDAYVGRTVIVSGEVDQVFSANGFLMGGDEFEDALIVVMPSDATVQGAREGEFRFGEDDVVQVRGTAQRITVAEIETDYGFDFDPETEVEIEDTQPVLVAQTIYLTPRVARSAEPWADVDQEALEEAREEAAEDTGAM